MIPHQVPAGPLIDMIVRMDADTSRKVQILRALAIVAVVVIHTCPTGLSQVIVRPFVNFGVGLFLFLSGWLTREAGFGMSFFRKRISRVLIPYVIWTVVYSLQRGVPDKILFNLLTTKACAAFYYVAVYVQFVILTPLLCRLADSRFRHAGWLVAPLAVVLFKYLPLLGVYVQGEYVSVAWNICCLGWFTYYYLGIMCARGHVQVKTGGTRLAVIYALALLLQVAEGYVWFRFGSPDCGSQLKLSSLASGAVAMLIALCYLHSARPVPVLSSLSSEAASVLSSGSVSSSRSSEADSGCLRHHSPGIVTGLIQVGNFSFGIYLTHILLIRILSGTTFYAALPFGVNTLLILLLSLASVMLLSKIIGPRLSRILGLC